VIAYIICLPKNKKCRWDNFLMNLSLGSSRSLPENEVKERLRHYGIEVPDYMVLTPGESLDGLTIVYPVVLKVCSAKIVHKTEVDGVRLGINDDEELVAALEDFRKRFPGENMLLEPMVQPGLEFIMGLINDPTFGLSIMVGMGGIYTEVYKDVTFRLVPIMERDAEEMLDDLQASVLFRGFRDINPDRKAVIRLLLTLSKMGLDIGPALQQMDLNPVVVFQEGLVVVDAKLIVGD
jgi:hypothetical protein